MSELEADVQRDDAAAQVVVRAALESRAFHHALQRLLIGMTADGLGEIAIARRVVREQRTESRQYLHRVDLVERREGPKIGLRELEHQQAPTRFEHFEQARERALLVGHVAQAETDRRAVERR